MPKHAPKPSVPPEADSTLMLGKAPEQHRPTSPAAPPEAPPLAGGRDGILDWGRLGLALLLCLVVILAALAFDSAR